MRIKPIHATVGSDIAPTVRAPLGITSGFTEGLGQMGQALNDVSASAGRISRTLQVIESKKKSFDDSVSLIELAGKAKLALLDHENVIQSTDYLDIDEANKRGLDAISRKMASEADSINPEVSSNWRKVWATLETSSNMNVGKIAIDKFRQRTIAGAISHINMLESEAVKATMENDHEALRVLNQSVNTVADNLRDNFKVPGTMTEGLKEGYRKGVEAKVAAAEREALKIHDKALLTGAYLGISQAARDPETGKVDYGKAYELLKKSDVWRSYGITVEQKKELTGIFTNEQARDKEIDDKIMENERNRLQKRVATGEATFDEIDATSLDADEKYSWKNRLLSRSKAINAGDEDPFKKVDPAIDNEVLQKIFSEDPPSVKEIRDLVGNGLSVKRAEHWIGVLNKPDAGYKRALTYLKQQIMPNKGLLVGESTSESSAYWDAVLELDEKMERAKADGVPLTGNDIIKEAREIMPKHQLTVQDQIEAMKAKLNPEKRKLEKAIKEKRPDISETVLKNGRLYDAN